MVGFQLEADLMQRADAHVFFAHRLTNKPHTSGNIMAHRVQLAFGSLTLAALLGVSLSTSAWALSPPAAAFLTSIGVDPADKEVKLADEDGEIVTEYDSDPVSFSLETLATTKKANAVRTFVGTRTFIRHLKKDFGGTSLPKVNYDPLYLTLEERALAGRKFVSSMRH